MPILCYENKRVFFSHIPKTGGTAVESFFAKTPASVNFWSKGLHGKGGLRFPCSPQHFHSDVINAMFGEGFFHFKFAVVRHPIERVLSEFRMKVGPRLADGRSAISFDAWVERVLERYDRNPYILDNHFRPQVEFVDGATQVFRYEDGLEGAISVAAKALGLPVEEKIVLPRRNVGIRCDVSPSEETLERIYNFFRGDFDAFGYNFKLQRNEHRLKTA